MKDSMRAELGAPSRSSWTVNPLVEVREDVEVSASQK
jgi:hypothetical protein